MSVLKNIFSAGKLPKYASAGPETAPVKMNLEERMAFRRELLYEAIKVTMQAHGILSASYRFRVARNDRRGHQYSVMMDLSTDFLHNREGRPEQLVALGTAMARNAVERYGLIVKGVYWQVNDQIQGFEVSRPHAQRGDDGAAAPDLSKRERSRAEELAAFEAAWQERQEGQELHVRDRVYASDLAPLGGDSDGGR